MISVIIPTYNRCKLLPRAIESVLSQTFTDLELIVVDDASSDETPQLMASYSDPRVRYIRQPANRGACAARNVGVQAAKGEYIAFQDSDDVWLTDKLEKQLPFLASSGADVVFCAFRHFTGEKAGAAKIVPDPSQVNSPITSEQLLMGNVISTQTILGKRSCFIQYPFDESFPRMQDWELVLRLAQHCRIAFQPLALVDVYLQSDSISRNPQAGLTAYLKLREMYREVLAHSDMAARQFAVGVALMACQCGQNPWKRYLGFIAPGLKLSTNLYLLRRSVQALVLKR
ncbi:MAG: glycosyltransferase family 2 protein [Clostridia bacterium]|nr:glycosyltransferase family 2 protein [Clostridia bacterium]